MSAISRRNLMLATLVTSLPNLLIGSWLTGGQGFEKAAEYGAAIVTGITVTMALALYFFSKNDTGGKSIALTTTFLFVLFVALVSYYGGATLAYALGTTKATFISFGVAIVLMLASLGVYTLLPDATKKSLGATTAANKMAVANQYR